METKLNLNFYQQLGKLYYAVADSDNNIQQEEINKLKKIVREEWVPIEDSVDEFGTDAAYQIEIVFDWLLDFNYDSKHALADFKEYYLQHEYFFTHEVKYLILKTANAIAHSFFGKNKSELIFLTNLQSILYS
jgi:hypothetical protein